MLRRKLKQVESERLRKVCTAFGNIVKEWIFVRPAFEHIIMVAIKRQGFLDKCSDKV